MKKKLTIYSTVSVKPYEYSLKEYCYTITKRGIEVTKNKGNYIFFPMTAIEHFLVEDEA